MIPTPPQSSRTDPLFPYTSLFRSEGHVPNSGGVGGGAIYQYDLPARFGKSFIQIAALYGWGLIDFDRSNVDLNKLGNRSEEHTSELQSLMRISYAVFCLKKKTRHLLVSP